MFRIKSLILRACVRVILFTDGWRRVDKIRWRKSNPNGSVVLVGDWRYALSQFIHLQERP